MFGEHPRFSLTYRKKTCILALCTAYRMLFLGLWSLVISLGHKALSCHKYTCWGNQVYTIRLTQKVTLLRKS